MGRILKTAIVIAAGAAYVFAAYWATMIFATFEWLGPMHMCDASCSQSDTPKLLTGEILVFCIGLALGIAWIARSKRARTEAQPSPPGSN